MEFLFLIIILIMSVVIHEVAHGYVALALGDPTAKYEGRLTLNPVSHLDPIGSVLVPLLGYFAGGFVIGWAKPVPFNPYNLKNQRWGEPLIAAAGPLVNLLLAVIFGVLIRILGANGLLNATSGGLMEYIVFINIVLTIFNLVPIPPLDGSKILFAFLPYRWRMARVYLERFGLILVLLLIFFFWQFITPLVGRLFGLLTGITW